MRLSKNFSLKELTTSQTAERKGINNNPNPKIKEVKVLSKDKFVITLEDNTIITYLVKGEYNPTSEHSIVWNTVDEVKKIINTYTNEKDMIISEKDTLGK